MVAAEVRASGKVVAGVVPDTAAAKVTATVLLGVEEEEEKEAASKTGKGKKKKAKATRSTANAKPATAAPTASAPKPVLNEGLPTAMTRAAVTGDAQAVVAWLDEGGCVDARAAESVGLTLLQPIGRYDVYRSRLKGKGPRLRFASYRVA